MTHSRTGCVTTDILIVGKQRGGNSLVKPALNKFLKLC